MAACLVAAGASWLRGKKYIHPEDLAEPQQTQAEEVEQAEQVETQAEEVEAQVEVVQP
jgi:hypothetical protein